MTPLREKMISDMQLHRLANTTQDSYLRSVTGLAKYFNKSPESISEEELKEYILYLINERGLKWSTINIITAGLRFFYIKTLKRKDLALSIPIKKTPSRLPEVFSPDELLKFFSSVANQKHRVMLMTTYAGGLRISELIKLKVGDIDSKRMMIRVEKGKFSKDRYTILSPKLLCELRIYWKRYRPTYWLFPNAKTGTHLTKTSPRLAFAMGIKRSGIKKKVTFHSLRHAFATHMLEAGVGIRTIQVLMGHATINSTARYLHIAQKKLSSSKSPLDILYCPDTSSQ
jgi:integrase/recombinase XerD